MKNLILLSGVLLIVLTNCNKKDVEFKTDLKKINIIKEINEFKPNSNEGVVLYKEFVNEIEIKENGLRNIEPVDKLASEAVWQFQTTLNSFHGFPFRMARKFEKVIDTYTYEIKSYGVGGMPILDGNDIYMHYVSKRNETISNNNDSVAFWCCFVEVDTLDLNNDELRLQITSIRAQNFPYILPPGVDPIPFPDYTCMYACYPSYCDGKYWKSAAEEYEKKIEFWGPPPEYEPYNYYIDLHSMNGFGPDSPGINGRLYKSVITYYILDTDGEDELNGYLMSTKEVIDENNYTGGVYFLGYFSIVPFSDDIPWNEHLVTLWFYEIIHIPDIE
ncbi:MAG: hypothetical protein KQH67_03300 [Bacteroidetes bacterium]|nr:hypothetical protein [Bacteroidota bacterium]